MVSRKRRLGEQREEAIYFHRKESKQASPEQPPTYNGQLRVSEKVSGFSLPAACLIVSTLPQPGPPLCNPQAMGTSETAQKACTCPLSIPKGGTDLAPKATDFSGTQVTHTSSRCGSLMETG